MVTVHDVARYILERQSPMSAMKLQKLLYYSQAWSLVWDETPLFPEPIEAWVNGPVIREVYEQHRGQFQVESWPRGDATALSEHERETVDSVLKFYGDKTAQYLSDLTHCEEPWKLARQGLANDDRSSREITLASMHEYYGGLGEEE